MSEPKRNAPRPHGPGRGMMPTEKAKDFKGSFKNLISYLSPFKFKILIVVIFAALSTVFTIVGPKILAKATDGELTAGLMRIITGAAEGIDFGYIAKVLLFLVGLYALSALFSYIQGFTMSGVSAKVSYNMRRAIMRRSTACPSRIFTKRVRVTCFPASRTMLIRSARVLTRVSRSLSRLCAPSSACLL